MQQSDFLYARNHSTIAITTIEGPLTDIHIINNTVNKIQVSIHGTIARYKNLFLYFVWCNYVIQYTWLRKSWHTLKKRHHRKAK